MSDVVIQVEHLSKLYHIGAELSADVAERGLRISPAAQFALRNPQFRLNPQFHPELAGRRKRENCQGPCLCYNLKVPGQLWPDWLSDGEETSYGTHQPVHIQ